MAIAFSATKQTAEAVTADLLAVPVFVGREAGPGADVVDDLLGRSTSLERFMEEAGFSGKLGQTLPVPAVDGIAARAVLLVGVGEREKVDAAALRRAGAAVARRAKKASVVVTTLASASTGLDPADAAQATAEGIALGAYEFLDYKSDAEPSELGRVVLATDGAGVSAALERATVITDAVCWARDLVNEPSGTKSPTEFANAARKLLTGKGVTVTVLGEAQLRAEKMGGVIGVAQGSERPPRFVKVVYNPPGGKARGTVALVGKGVTFDSGGISIKPAEGMEAMKTDMGGAAATLATMATLKALGVKARVVAYAPMVENMPSGAAIRPGDVLRMRSGTTVEVLNTDAEGRLILADALSLAVDDGVDAIVDLATLTGACVVALGEKVAGLMGNEDGWIEQVRSASERAGEPTWHLPLPDDMRTQLDSEVADLRNIGANRYGGALTAGLFLDAFVEDVPWAHLDIAGPARAPSDDGELARGGTGFGVRTLVQLLLAFERPAATNGNKSGHAKRSKKKAPAKKSPSKKPSSKKASKKSPVKKRTTKKKAASR
jgi:leucyl aminopeptidase